ncbi:MAG: ISAs1 family transposase [Methylococcales bacterium]
MPKKTLKLILDAGCHYLVQIKRNCRTLWENIALHTALLNPIAVCEYYQEGHDHRVWRRVELYNADQLHVPAGWQGIQRLIKVRRWGYRNNQYFEQRAFYVLSKPLNSALQVAQAIQGHWSIENNLHWIKDVNLREDELKGKNKDMVTLMVYLNNLALNILRTAGYKPVRDTFAKFANKVNELYTLF